MKQRNSNASANFTGKFLSGDKNNKMFPGNGKPFATHKLVCRPDSVFNKDTKQYEKPVYDKESKSYKNTNKKDQYFELVSFGKLAEKLYTLIESGNADFCRVMTTIENYDYQNKEGKTVYATRYIVYGVEYYKDQVWKDLFDKEEADDEQPAHLPVPQANMIDDEDLPF